MRTNEITVKFPITVILTVVRKQRSERTSYLTNGYNVMNYFAKFEKFLSQYNYAKFYNCSKSNARVRRGASLPLSYKLSSQNAPYKVVLNNWLRNLIPIMNWL